MGDRMKNSKKGIFLLAFSLVVCIGLTYRVYTSSNLRYDRAKQIVKNEENIQGLKSEIRTIHSEIKESNSMGYVEQVAREDLGMVRPREIIFVDEGAKAPDQESQVEEGGN